MGRALWAFLFVLVVACSSGGGGGGTLPGDGGAGTGGSAGSAGTGGSGGSPFCSTCAEMGVQCGIVKNSCGLSTDCGTCATNENCVAGKCECTPKSCSELGATCGTPDDGCGTALDCGDPCTAPETCGGGGTPYTCGCTPKTCAGAGANCGALDDGCGTVLDCGTCVAPKSCGGGGTQNVCGCLPASQEGPLDPTAAVNDASIGSRAWSGVTKVFAEDNQYAEISAMIGGQVSNYLVTSGFGFNLPSTATITGIKVEVRRWALSGVGIEDNEMRLMKSGAPSGAIKLAPGGKWTKDQSYVAYGGPGDLWSTTWTPADINATSFGAALSVKYTSTAGNDWPRVDRVRITVYFDVVCN